MKGSIRLHPEHGVNPTIPTCFWCGKDRNEVELLGAGYKGRAPMHMVLDYNPCDECQTNMAKGITLIECTERATDQRPPLQGNMYPTGRWCVITEDAARRMIKSEDLLASVLKHRKTFVEPGIIPADEQIG